MGLDVRVAPSRQKCVGDDNKSILVIKNLELKEHFLSLQLGAVTNRRIKVCRSNNQRITSEDLA